MGEGPGVVCVAGQVDGYGFDVWSEVGEGLQCREGDVGWPCGAGALVAAVF